MPTLRNLVLHAVAVIAVAAPAAAQSYKVTNLLSDGSVPATTTDPKFINPWAISASPNFWISAAGSGYNYVVPGTGVPAFKVIVPTAAAPNTAPGLPAGSVTTGGALGMLLSNGAKASFVFSTLDGTISGWNGRLGTNDALSIITVNNSAAGASYPGLALLNIAPSGTTTASYLLAANFGTGNAIEVYDSTFARTTLSGGTFTDPNLPAGYSPFGIHIIGTQVYVTYAQRTTTRPFLSVNGPGNGIVSVFDNTGKFVARVATAGQLNAPWGVAMAPANFGIFSNTLLIGNFGDGHINAYDPKTFAYIGQLTDSTGKPLTYASLWEILPGGAPVTGTTAVGAGDPNSLYFTAGLDSEKHGLLGAISNGTTTGATPTFGFSTSDSALSATAGGSAQTTISVAPVNSFSGSVTLSCTGLPAGASCAFASPTMSVSSTAAATSQLFILTSKATTTSQLFGFPAGIAAAMLLPFAAFLRRRKIASVMTMRVITGAALFIASAALITGCAGSSNSGSTTVGTTTPAGTSNVTVTAISGAITQSTTMALTVK